MFIKNRAPGNRGGNKSCRMIQTRDARQLLLDEWECLDVVDEVGELEVGFLVDEAPPSMTPPVRTVVLPPS